MENVQKVFARSKKIYVGLEDSKRTWKLCVRCQGIRIDALSIPSDFNNLKNYLLNGYPDCKITVIYEAGFSGFWLHDKLQTVGIMCIVTPPHTVTEEKCNKVKNDKIDARRLAKVLENNDYKACYVPDVHLREDRQISRTLFQVQKIIVATKNRIRKFFDFHGLNEGFKAGEWGVKEYRHVHQVSLSEPLAESMNVLLTQLDLVNTQKKNLRNNLLKMANQERYKTTVDVLSNIPGVGRFTAVRLALEWGPVVQRFKNGRHLASFVGFVGREHSTGETEHKGHITKQGSGFVRHMIVECSWKAIGKDYALREKYYNVLRNCGKKQIAIVAVARKMVVRMFTILKKEEMYKLDLAA